MSSLSVAARPIRLIGRAILSAIETLASVLATTARRMRSVSFPPVLATIVVLVWAMSVTPAASVAAPAGAPPRSDAAAGTTARWAWPVPAPHPVLRPFIAPASAYGAGHRGIDVGAAVGTEVLAPEDGVVFFSGVVVDRPVLSITHADGLVSSYEPVASPLAAGTPVSRGDVVGTVVAGHCVEGCLHFGARLHGEYVSPLNYLGGVPRAVLLPTRRP